VHTQSDRGRVAQVAGGSRIQLAVTVRIKVALLLVTAWGTVCDGRPRPLEGSHSRSLQDAKKLGAAASPQAGVCLVVIGPVTGLHFM
jgi:hypothetical protein